MLKEGTNKYIEGKLFSIEFNNYIDQFQIGITFSIHKRFTWHVHILFDLGFYYIEVTFGRGE